MLTPPTKELLPMLLLQLLLLTAVSLEINFLGVGSEWWRGQRPEWGI